MAALGTNMGNKPKPQSSEKKKAKAKDSVKTSPKKGVAQSTTKKKAASKKNTAQKTSKIKLVAKNTETKKAAVKKPKVIVTKKTKVAVPKKVVDAKKVKKEGASAKSVKKVLPKKQEKKPVLRNANLILEPSKRQKIRKTKVILEGDLNINNVDAFMAEIDPIFDDYDFVDFFQREVTSIDLSHVQMLNYFKNHPTRKGKTVTINSEVSAEMKKVVIAAGLKELLFIPKLV